MTAGPVAAQKTDHVLMRNGDDVTGEVKQLYRGKLSYSTDDMGTVEIEWVNVRRLISTQFHEVELKNGDRYFGILLPPADDGVIVVGLDDVADTLALIDVVRIFPIETSFWQRLKGRVDFGFNFKKANELKQLSLKTEWNYRVEKWAGKLSGEAYFQGQEGVADVTRNNVSLRYQRFLGHKWSYLGVLSVEENSELNLDRRTSFLGGGGLFFIQSNRAIAQVLGGLALTNELFSGETQTQYSLEGVIGGELAYFRFDSPKTDVSLTASIVPGITEWGRVRANVDLRISYEVLSDFTVGLTFFNSFDNRGGAEGTSKNDLGVELLLGWKYN
jgi:hypothetical protein